MLLQFEKLFVTVCDVPVNRSTLNLVVLYE